MTSTKINFVNQETYPKGLSMSIQEWANRACLNLENSFANRIDCATAFSLMQLSNGDNLDFIAFRYRSDDKDALAIVTESMKIDSMSLGMWSHIKFTNMPDFCQTLVNNSDEMGIDVIALRVGDTERVYWESLMLEQKLIWTQDAKKTIDDHRVWKANKVLNVWSAKINVEYTMQNKVPGNEVLLEFLDEWSQYADVDTNRVREKLMSLQRKDIKDMLGKCSFGFHRMILHMSYD